MNKGTKGCLGCFGAVFFSVLILFLGLYVYSEWIWEEWPTERIERVSGVKVPSYKIMESHKGKRAFTGDHEDRFEIEFKNMPSDELFDEIDSLITNGNTGWQRNGNKYYFSVVWGNGLPTPNGESDSYDGTFSITITKGVKFGEIRSGSW
jgi:hypothetical protein